MLHRFAVGRHWLFQGCLFSLLLASASLEAETKYVRLRNEIIATEESGKAKPILRAQSLETAVSGLFLIQFNDRLQPAWRDQLRDLRVDLLRYVPDDAFIAKVNGARLSQIRALP